MKKWGNNQKSLKATESQEQIALFEWAILQEGKYPELKLLFHIPNGGKRDIVTAARLKAEGVKAGVLDLLLPVSRDGFHGLFIEMKAQDGKLSLEQKWWIEQLKAQRYLTCVCYEWTEAAEAIINYLK